MNPNRSPEKAAMSAEIQSHVEAFLAKGGEIQQIPRGVVTWGVKVDFMPSTLERVKTKTLKAARESKPKQQTKVERVEQDYGKPFLEVVEMLAKDGMRSGEMAKKFGMSIKYFSNLVCNTNVAKILRPVETYTLNGVTGTLSEHGKRRNITLKTIKYRMEKGETVEQALNYAPSPRLERLMAQIGEMTA